MKELSATLEKYYESVSYDTIDFELKKQLYAVADKLVEEFLSKTDIKTVFISRADNITENDIVVIQLKAKIK